MYAYQWWADTTTGLLKIRNAANSAWVTIGTLASANLGLLPLAGGTMTGVLAVTAGTAALPGIAVSGDLNTGIYSPGADQIGIATGGISRIVVDASGNVNIDSNTLYVDAANNRVGLGTSAPDTRLEINDQSSGVETFPLYVSNQGTGVGTRATIRFDVANFYYGSIGGGEESGIGGSIIIDAPGSGGVIRFTKNNKATEIARFDASGRLGIGITPSFLLDANSGSTAATGRFLSNSTTAYSATSYNGGSARLTLSGGSATSSFTGTQYSHGGNVEAFFGIVQNSSGLGDFVFQGYNGSAYAERLRIDTSGRLLVGTIASPANQLQVSTDSAGKPSSALWTIVSDERIKEDIELADLDLCYEAIKAIPLKRYKWRDEIYTAEQVTDRRKLGWIAQDVETVFPKAVGTHEFKYNQVFEETIIPAVEEELDADGNVITPAQPERTEQGDLISEDVIEDCRNLNSDQLYAAMYGAVQKLMAKVESLEASNADLLARVAALEAA
jgi:hypothetical protein